MKNEVRWQYLTEKEIIEAFAADIHAGLSENAVSRIRGRFGFNSIWQTEKVSAKNIVFANLFDAPVLLLLISAFITAFVGQYPAFAVICAVLFVSCGFRICCEFLYRRAVSSNVRSGLFRVSVVRDGKMKNIFADELVPGDIVILRKGDTAGADLRIIESNGLSVIENGVTDNSGAVPKAPGRLTDSTANTPCEKWSNMVFASSEVVSGHARAVAVACGKHTLVYKKRGTKKIEGIRRGKGYCKGSPRRRFFCGASPCVFADLYGSLHFFARREIQHKRYIHRRIVICVIERGSGLSECIVLLPPEDNYYAAKKRSDPEKSVVGGACG